LGDIIRVILLIHLAFLGFPYSGVVLRHTCIDITLNEMSDRGRVTLDVTPLKRSGIVHEGLIDLEFASR
jgi:hypothetical protein